MKPQLSMNTNNSDINYNRDINKNKINSNSNISDNNRNENNNINEEKHNKINEVVKGDNNESYELRNRKLLRNRSRIHSRNSSTYTNNSNNDKIDGDHYHDAFNNENSYNRNNTNVHNNNKYNNNNNNVGNDVNSLNSNHNTNDDINNMDEDKKEINKKIDEGKNDSYGVEGNNNSNRKTTDKTQEKNKTTRVGQIIKLLEGIEPYDIVEELRKTPANINLAQLLGISSALRSDINKSFKKTKSEENLFIGYAECYNDIENFEIVNNPTHSYCTKEIQEHDIAIVNGSVNGCSAAILIDGGSNANLVSRKFLNQNIKNYTIVGSTSGRVHQALSSAEERIYEIVPLEVTIGTLKINEKFRIITP